MADANEDATLLQDKRAEQTRRLEAQEADSVCDLQHPVVKKEDSVPFCPMVNGLPCSLISFFQEKSGKNIRVDIFFCNFAH